MSVKLSNLKRNPFILRNVRWDVTPKDLFKPRFTGMGNQRELHKETEGYMFYIDLAAGPPKLMLMRTLQLMSSTEAEIDDAPQEMLIGAVGAGGAKSVAGMYPISAEVEAWIKKELGLSP